MTAPVRIETCRACGVSFEVRDDEPMPMFVSRYTAFRELHGGCVLPQAAEPVAETGARSVGVRGIAARFRQRVQAIRAGERPQEPSLIRLPRRETASMRRAKRWLAEIKEVSPDTDTRVLEHAATCLDCELRENNDPDFCSIAEALMLDHESMAAGAKGG